MCFTLSSPNDPIQSDTGLNDGENPQERRHRLQCAFTLAEEASGGRRGSLQLKQLDRTGGNTSSVMTAADAFPPSVACPVWEVLGPAAKALGYNLPNRLTEAECRGHGRRFLREV